MCVYFLLLSRRGAMISSGENSFPSEPLSRGDRCLSRVVELETASSAGISVRIAELRRMAFLLALSRTPWSTPRRRKTDSNSQSLREGKGYGQPLQASIAVSDVNL